MEPSGLSVTIDTAPEYPDYNHELVITHPAMDPASGVSITVDTAPDYEFYPDFLEHEAIYKRQADVFPPVVVVKRQADPHEPRPSQSATCNCPPCNVTAGTEPVKNCWKHLFMTWNCLWLIEIKLESEMLNLFLDRLI